MGEGVIYQIVNKTNNKRYIGLTTNIRERQRSHFSLLNNNNHYNKYLQRSFNKYGSNSFEFNIIEKNLFSEELPNREVYWIAYYNSYEKGYNLTVGGEFFKGENHPTYGVPLTQEHKDKIGKTSRKRGINSGINNSMAKVDKKLGVQIYKEYESTSISKEKLADNHGVSRSVVGRITNGKHWTTEGFPPLVKNIKQFNTEKRCKLKKDSAIKMYNLYKNTDVSMKELGNQFNCSITTVNRVVKGKHIHTESEEPIYHKNRKLTKDEVKSIEVKLNQGVSLNSLAEEYDVSGTTIRNIREGRHWGV